MPIQIIAGEPGETWTNDTGKFRYQLVAELQNTCGRCLQYHMQIGPLWPIPIHHSCRCVNVAVPPGATAHPFVDFREIIRDLPIAQRNRVIGASAIRLVESGVLKWGDVVTAGRIRTLAEVVAKKRLTVESMVKAGLSPARAKLTHASAHPEIVETAKRTAASLAKVLTDQGMTREQVIAITGHEVASRVRLGAGPSPETGIGVTIPKKPVPILPYLLARKVIYLKTEPEMLIAPDDARRLLFAAVGDAAAEVGELPKTRGELDAAIMRLNGHVNHDALRAMMERLGIKP